MITEGPYSLSLNTADVLNCPLAMGGNGPVGVQVQNASPFIVNVMSNGQVYTIQAFTAQTVPLSGGGEDIIVTPISGPAGTNGNLVAVWLLQGEQPPMADGQLTGAAQFAQGLGSILLGPVTAVPAGQTVAIPPNVRTLIVSYTNGSALAELQVVGQTSGFYYYNNGNGTYLQGSGVSQPNAVAVFPVNPILDPVVELFANTTGAEVTVVGDTAQYEESVFYNGAAAVPTVSTPGTNQPLGAQGPRRLLAANVHVGGTSGSALLIVNGSALLRVDGTDVSDSITLPPNTIIDTLTYTIVTAGTVSAVTAYP